MTRTYLRSGSTASSNSRPKLTGGGGWRSQELTGGGGWRSKAVSDDSLLQSPIFRNENQGSRRKPLTTLGHPGLFSPESDAGLGNNEDVNEDPFDRLCKDLKKLKVKNKKETVDPFDVMMESGRGTYGDTGKINPRHRMFENSDAGMSSPDRNDKENSRDVSCKLFSSFSRQEEGGIKFKPLKAKNKAPAADTKVKRPKSYRGRTTKSSVSLKKAPEVAAAAKKPYLNETLQTKLVFRKASSAKDQSAASGPFPSKASPVLTSSSFSIQSPANFRFLRMTSTPILLKSVKSSGKCSKTYLFLKSLISVGSGIGIPNTTSAPELEDDVFSPNPGSPIVRNPGDPGESKKQKSHSGSESSVSALGPTPLKSFIKVKSLS